MYSQGQSLKSFFQLYQSIIKLLLSFGVLYHEYNGRDFQAYRFTFFVMFHEPVYLSFSFTDLGDQFFFCFLVDTT